MSLSDKEITVSECPQCKLSLPFDGAFSRIDIKQFIKDVLEAWAEVPDDEFPDAIVKLAGKRLAVMTQNQARGKNEP